MDASSFSSDLSGKAIIETGVLHFIAVKVEEQVTGDKFS